MTSLPRNRSPDLQVLILCTLEAGGSCPPLTVCDSRQHAYIRATMDGYGDAALLTMLLGQNWPISNPHSVEMELLFHLNSFFLSSFPPFLFSFSLFLPFYPASARPVCRVFSATKRRHEWPRGRSAILTEGITSKTGMSRLGDVVFPIQAGLAFLSVCSSFDLASRCSNERDNLE